MRSEPTCGQPFLWHATCYCLICFQYFKKVSLILLTGVVLASILIGGLGELTISGSLVATLQDVTIGWPGLLLQIAGTYLICKYV